MSAWVKPLMARESSAWRHRLFKTLVHEKGFTVYAGEIPWAEALAVDDYVVHGQGSARAAITGLSSWKDDIEEVLALVEWMRTYNADPSHCRKLHFVGFDVLTPRAVTLVLEYPREVDPGTVPELEPTLAPFAGIDAESTYPSLPPSERGRPSAALGTLVAKLDANRSRYARAGRAAWVRARACARVLERASFSHADYSARAGKAAPPALERTLPAHGVFIQREGPVRARLDEWHDELSA